MEAYPPSLTPIGTYSTGIFDDAAAAILAHDPLKQNLFVTNKSDNTIDVLDISDPTNPSLSSTIDIESFGTSLGTVNSVDFSNGILAAAVENKVKTDPGSVLFFNYYGDLLHSVEVGALPDMLTFTPDGEKVLVANEGEPNDDYSVDPEGSVSIIDVLRGVDNQTVTTTVTTVDFIAFNDREEKLGRDGVRIFGPNATVAQDLEPEYIAVSEDSKKAWVTLQENNAIGILDLKKGKFKKVVGLGFKDHSLPQNGLDASNKDDAINITTYPNLFGMYQPDEIASYSVGRKTYLVTANEGDSRQFGDFDEEVKVKDLPLDPNAFPDADLLQQDEVLGRLEVTNTLGDTDGDGDFDELYAFGGRSFAIWDEYGNLVFDSGDQFEKIIAARFPEDFNSNNDENQSFDNRSDNKGPEPEGITLAVIGGRTLAFIGLERMGGIITYDITNPFNPFFVDYTNNRDFSVIFDVDQEGDPDPTPEQLDAVGDLGPEGLLFIPRHQSPNGKPLLVVANEVSGTTTLYSTGYALPKGSSHSEFKLVNSWKSSWEMDPGGEYFGEYFKDALKEIFDPSDCLFPSQNDEKRD